MAYMRQYGKIYKEKLGPMWIVHLFDPTDLATMFRLEGRYPSRGKIAGIEVSYLQRNNKLVGFAFRLVTSLLVMHGRRTMISVNETDCRHLGIGR